MPSDRRPSADSGRPQRPGRPLARRRASSRRRYAARADGELDGAVQPCREATADRPRVRRVQQPATRRTDSAIGAGCESTADRPRRYDDRDRRRPVTPGDVPRGSDEPRRTATTAAERPASCDPCGRVDDGDRPRGTTLHGHAPIGGRPCAAVATVCHHDRVEPPTDRGADPIDGGQGCPRSYASRVNRPHRRRGSASSGSTTVRCDLRPERPLHAPSGPNPTTPRVPSGTKPARRRKSSDLAPDVAEELTKAAPAARAAKYRERLTTAADALDRGRFDDARRMVQPVLRDLPDMAFGHEIAGLAFYRPASGARPPPSWSWLANSTGR